MSFIAMMKKNLILISIIITFLAGILLFFAQNYLPESSHVDNISVATSFYSLAYFAKIVGGDMVAVRNLTPPGVEPHDFEPSPRDLVFLSKADLFIYNGALFEPWVEKWRAGGFVESRQLVDIATELVNRDVVLKEYHGEIDPHLWLDPLIAQREIEVIRDVLSKIDPSHFNTYQLNAERALQRLASLDEHLRIGLQSCALHDIIVSHEAFGYFAGRYGISATAIAGISPEEEPSSKELARMVDLARAKKIKFIFFETAANPRLAETVAREIGGGTLVLNPIESLTQDEVQSGEDYFSLMEKNLINLRIALECE